MVTKSIERAQAQVESLTPAEVEEKLKEQGVTLIDLRDIRVQRCCNGYGEAGHRTLFRRKYQCAQPC